MLIKSAEGKQRRISANSQDLRQQALQNSYWQRRKDGLVHTKDSASEPDASRSSVVTFRPLRPVIDDRCIARSSSATSMACENVLALRSLGRRTTTSLDFQLPHPRQPSRDRLHLSSPTRRNNPHPNGLVYQSSYNRHNKAYEIWIPNKRLIQIRLPKMMHHLNNVNFLCKHANSASSGAKMRP